MNPQDYQTTAGQQAWQGESKRSRRPLLVVGAIVAAVVLLFLTLTLFKGKTIYPSDPIAANFAFAHQLDDDTLYYFSNSAFVSYDLKTKRTTPMTTLYSFPLLITEVHWAKDGALMRATGYSPVDQLYPTLVQQSLDLNRDYWWYINFKTDAVSLIGDPSTQADVRDAVWQDDSTIAYTEYPGDGTDITLKTLQLGSAATTLTTLSEDNLLTASNKEQSLFLRTKDDTQELVRLDHDTKKTSTLVNDVIDVLATDRQSALLLTQTGESEATDMERGRLVLYDASSGKTKTLSDSFQGSAVWHGNEWAAVGLNNDSQFGFRMKDGKQESFKFKPLLTDGDQTTEHYTTIGISGDFILLTNDLMQLVYAGEYLPEKLPELPDFGFIQTDIYETKFQYNYRKNTNQYSVYILQEPYAENRQFVMDYFKGRNYDPYQLNIKWYADDGVNTGFYLPPEAEVPFEPDETLPDYYDVGD
jgi:hypothetical protein